MGVQGNNGLKDPNQGAIGSLSGLPGANSGQAHLGNFINQTGGAAGGNSGFPSIGTEQLNSTSVTPFLKPNSRPQD